MHLLLSSSAQVCSELAESLPTVLEHFVIIQYLFSADLKCHNPVTAIALQVIGHAVQRTGTTSATQTFSFERKLYQYYFLHMNE